MNNKNYSQELYLIDINGFPYRQCSTCKAKYPLPLTLWEAGELYSELGASITTYPINKKVWNEKTETYTYDHESAINVFTSEEDRRLIIDCLNKREMEKIK